MPSLSPSPRSHPNVFLRAAAPDCWLFGALPTRRCCAGLPIRTPDHTHTHTHTHTQARTHTHTHTLFDACSRQLLTERMKQRQVRCDPPFTSHTTSSHHPAVLTLRVDVPLCFLCFMQLLLPTYSLLGPPALRSVQNTVLCFFPCRLLYLCGTMCLSVSVCVRVCLSVCV